MVRNRRSTLMYATAVVACGLLTAPAFGDWRNTKWGMSPADVSDAVSTHEDGQPIDHTSSLPIPSDSSDLGRKVMVRVLEFDVPAKFSYKKGGLYKVGIWFDTRKSCLAVSSALRQKYGEATSATFVGSEVVSDWEDVSHNNNVEFIRPTTYNCYLSFRALNK